MKKIISCFFILCLFFISSCGKDSTVINNYNETNDTEYLNLFYEEINTENEKWIAVDLRSKVDYEESHLRQFQNYDVSASSLDDLVSWLKLNNSLSTKVYLYCETEQKELNEKLQNTFTNIYILSEDFDEMKTTASEQFVFDSGEYDCGC